MITDLAPGPRHRLSRPGRIPARLRYLGVAFILGWSSLGPAVSAQNSTTGTANGNKMSIQREPFGTLANGETVSRFTCTNNNGLRLVVTDFGAIVLAMEVPDRAGKLANVTLGFPDLAGYQQRHPYFGATVGRYCNRIAKGQFQLGGSTYRLATNNGPNHLHGGIEGFDRHRWQATEISNEDEVGVRFERTSPDGEEGYPGNLRVVATYTLNHRNELKMEFHAITDKTTVANLTNHCYWNLAGAGSGTVLDHRVMLAADEYLAVDPTLIPTGQRVPVTGTPLDFTQPHTIGERLAQVGGEPGGYDHCFVLRPEAGKLRLAAQVSEPKSGRVMEIYTTQPGIQLYSGNFLDGSAASGGFSQRAAFCLETQHFPDSPNHADFPSTKLEPGQSLHEVTVHRFLVE